MYYFHLALFLHSFLFGEIQPFLFLVHLLAYSIFQPADIFSYSVCFLITNYIDFYGKMYGIWIPSSSILKRNYYEWFARLSPEQIFTSQFILAKYFVLAMAPYTNDDKNENKHMSIIESLTSDTDPNSNDNSKNWISFWQVPSSTTLPIYGPKPLYIGNNVQQYKF